MLVTHADGLEQTLADGGRIGCLLGAEGGHSIDNSLGVLRTLYRLGVRYLTLTHNENTAWADSATDAPDPRRPDRLRPGGGGRAQSPRHAGRPVPRGGDHGARRARRQRGAGDLQPLLGSGASVIIRATSPTTSWPGCADNGGVCMITFVPFFVSPAACAWALEAKAAAEAAGIDSRDLRRDG